MRVAELKIRNLLIAPLWLVVGAQVLASCDEIAGSIDLQRRGPPPWAASVLATLDGSGTDTRASGGYDQAEGSVVIDDWTLVILPDTQYYTGEAKGGHEEMFLAQTRWIAENAERLNIRMVVHEGDVTQNGRLGQWNRAKEGFEMLDEAGVPYAIALGNHDYDDYNRDETSFTSDRYFGRGSSYAAQPTFGGYFDDETATSSTENSYHLFEAGEQGWIVLALEFGPRDEVVAWADAVLAAHSDRLAIIVTHAYMYWDDTRYDWATYGEKQNLSPHSYHRFATRPGGVNDGQQIWDGALRHRENVRFVFSGHVANDGTGHLESEGDHGNTVHQVLANYHGQPGAGNGFLRIATFYADGHAVDITSYSPYLDSLGEEPWKDAADQTFQVSMAGR